VNVTKVAVVFAGFPRFTKRCYESIEKNLLSQLPNYDIFANLQWNDNMVGTYPIRNAKTYNGKVFFPPGKKLYDINEGESFKQLYGPRSKKINFIEPMDFNTDWLNSSGHLSWHTIEESRAIANNMKCQFQCILDGIKLIDNLQDYTHIIRMRTDLIFERKIHPEEILQDITIIQDSRKHGSDRRYGDFFFVTPINHVGFFQELANLEEHFKHGILHIHLFMEKLTGIFPSKDKELDVVIVPGEYYND
jgi:hypothetical protein